VLATAERFHISSLLFRRRATPSGSETQSRFALPTRLPSKGTARRPHTSAASFPQLLGCAVKSAYLDGELCALDADGVPQFSRLRAAMDEGRTDELVFFAFDLLVPERQERGPTTTDPARG
jgi:hypothetical protein